MLPKTTTFLLITNIVLLLLKISPLHATPPFNPLNTTCHTTCGTIPVKYPFGSGFGCGHPDFGRTIKCTTSGTLQLTTASGTYIISSIDYTTNNVIVTDTFMSTCSSMQNSGSFRLDHVTPFNLVQQNTFVLLGCSATSPVYDKNVRLCDTGSASQFCKGLYSCKGMAGIGLDPNAPISSCCVYDPTVAIGLDYGLDLPKLQCSSYASIYGFGGDQGDPMKWEYGILLRFNDSYYSETCKNCEDSGGWCGFSGVHESFACICHNGINTTTNCFGRGSYAWSGSWRHKFLIVTISVGGLLLSVMLLFL